MARTEDDDDDDDVHMCECARVRVCAHSVIHNIEAPEQAPAGNVRGAL